MCAVFSFWIIASHLWLIGIRPVSIMLLKCSNHVHHKNAFIILELSCEVASFSACGYRRWALGPTRKKSPRLTNRQQYLKRESLSPRRLDKRRMWHELSSRAYGLGYRFDSYWEWLGIFLPRTACVTEWKMYLFVERWHVVSLTKRVKTIKLWFRNLK